MQRNPAWAFGAAAALDVASRHSEWRGAIRIALTSGFDGRYQRSNRRVWRQKLVRCEAFTVQACFQFHGDRRPKRLCCMARPLSMGD